MKNFPPVAGVPMKTSFHFHRPLVLTAFWFTVVLAPAAEPAPTAAAPADQPALAAFPPEAFAAIGSSFAQSSHLPELGWDEVQIAAFIEGVRAAFRGKPYPFDDTAKQVSAEMGRRVHEMIERQKIEAAAAYARPGRLEQYMKEMRLKLRLQLTASGLGYRVDPGRGGIRPRPGDTVVVTCAVTAADGVTKIPQLSAERAPIKMTDLLPGFMEGLQMMTVDAKAVFVLPPALSFGEGEWPEGVDRGTPMVFWVTLHEISSPPAAP
jgi:FKBP-type peptidyl-prolyl cis-trans isomerase